MAAHAIPTKYIEGLRLSERERSVLIEQMKKNGAVDRRRSPRIVVEGNFSVLLTMDAPGGSTAYLRIYPWDLSRGGVGFFHRAFVYPGTRCTFIGRTFEGKPFLISGEVVRCSHVSGNVHAVGTKLDTEIDPEAILGAHAAPYVAAAGAASEHADDWWTRMGAELAAVSKLARDKAPADAIRKAAEALVKHLAIEPAATTAGATTAPVAAPVTASAMATPDAKSAPQPEAKRGKAGA